MKKHTLGYVKGFFEEQGCDLLEKRYKDSRTKMKYRCECGDISKICFSSFQQGGRCMKCAIRNRANKRRHSFEYIYNCFKDEGCELLEDEYIGAHHKMKYICSCGNISEISFSNFQAGKRCKKCGDIKRVMQKTYKHIDIEQYFGDYGCKLLEKEYKGCFQKLKYICSCGNISTISFSSFRQGHRCSKCAGNEKLTLGYAEQYFKDQGCMLLEKKYINNSTPMKYLCSCGNIGKICFGNFQQGQRCKKCGIEKVSEGNKLLYKDVEQFFEDNGCKLLETEYSGSHTPMKYKCSCGKVSIISFGNFKKGQRCAKCGGSEKLTFEYVKQCFKDEGCELLEDEYINSKTKMRYTCNCGDISKISFYSFQQGGRCKKCGIKKRSGENHPNYNPNLTDEEREANKSRLSDYLYKKWRIGVYKRDLFICQKCFQKGKYLNGHHIESWGSCPELRLDEKNGITFCADCHKEFHHIYGYGNNTVQQLEEFLTTQHYFHIFFS